MKKKAFLFILIVAVISCAVFPCFASAAGAMSENEVKELILCAFQFYYKYQFSEEEITVNKTDISAEARKIYADDIADDMWMKRCYSKMGSTINISVEEWNQGLYINPQPVYDYYKKQDEQLYGNNGLTFTDNGNGTVTILPFAKSVMDWREYTHSFYGKRVDSQFAFWKFVVSKEYSTDFFSEKIRPQTVQDVTVKDVRTEGGVTKADVLIYSNDRDKGYIPVWAEVCFTETSDGMRISGGDLVYVLSDWSEVKDKQFSNDVSLHNCTLWTREQNNISDQTPSVSDHLMGNVARLIAAGAYYGIDPWDNPEPDLYPTGEYRFLYQDGNKAYYEIEFIYTTGDYLLGPEDGELYVTDYIGGKGHEIGVVAQGVSKGMLTAEFTFDTDFSFSYVYYDSTEFKGGWKLTGGEWYDLAVANGYNPDTGDSETIVLAVMAVTSLIGMAILFAKEQKRKNPLTFLEK